MSGVNQSEGKEKEIEMNEQKQFRKDPGEENGTAGQSTSNKQEGGLRKIGAMFFDREDTSAMISYLISPGSDGGNIMMRTTPHHGGAAPPQAALTQASAQTTIQGGGIEALNPQGG